MTARRGRGGGRGDGAGPGPRPRLAVTVGDPRGIGPEIVAAALVRPELRHEAEFLVLGPEAGPDSGELPADVEREAVGPWEPGGDEVAAGRVCGRAIERAVELALAGRVDGLVTGPISKRALAAAGYPYPGHTEFLRARTGAAEVTMMMASERTPLGGPLRLALLTAHLPLREVAGRLTRELVLSRGRIAVRALREWWGFDRPRLAFAGVNPHASEGGLFGDEEERILAPAARALGEEGEAEIAGVFPADTVFSRCIDGRVDAVVVPYHDVGLAVLKTLARDSGVNVTAGLPFPRTAPDHGTAFDIAGRGRADPGSFIAAARLCARFARAGLGEGRDPAEARP